jgi:hypothetical protein
MTTDTTAQATDQVEDLEALHAAWLAATGKRVQLTERETAVQAEIDGGEAELDALYVADPMRQDTVERQARLARLRGELEDIRRRLPGARAAEQRAHEAHQAEQRRAQAVDREARATQLRVAAGESDRAIDAAVRVLQDALDERRSLVDERDRLRAEARLAGELVELAEVDFDAARIPAMRRDRLRHFLNI